MRRQLDDPDLVICVYPNDLQRPAADGLAVQRIEAIAAAKLLHDQVLSIYPVGARTVCDLDCLCLADQRTCQLADHQLCAIGDRFLVRCIAEAEHIPCILYQSMLKAPSSAEKRHIPLAGVADGRQRAFHALVGDARSAPQRVVLRQDCLIIRAF